MYNNKCLFNFFFLNYGRIFFTPFYVIKGKNNKLLVVSNVEQHKSPCRKISSPLDPLSPQSSDHPYLQSLSYGKVGITKSMVGCSTASGLLLLHLKSGRSGLTRCFIYHEVNGRTCYPKAMSGCWMCNFHMTPYVRLLVGLCLASLKASLSLTDDSHTYVH